MTIPLDATAGVVTGSIGFGNVGASREVWVDRLGLRPSRYHIVPPTNVVPPPKPRRIAARLEIRCSFGGLSGTTSKPSTNSIGTSSSTSRDGMGLSRLEIGPTLRELTGPRDAPPVTEEGFLLSIEEPGGLFMIEERGDGIAVEEAGDALGVRFVTCIAECKLGVTAASGAIARPKRYAFGACFGISSADGGGSRLSENGVSSSITSDMLAGRSMGRLAII